MAEKLLQATVSVRGIILDGGGQTLVVRRSSDGAWEFPGGRLGPQEGVEPGLQREIEEETTLNIDVGEIFHANAWQNNREDGRFAVYYRCSPTVVTIRPGPDACSDGEQTGPVPDRLSRLRQARWQLLDGDGPRWR